MGGDYSEIELSLDLAGFALALCLTPPRSLEVGGARPSLGHIGTTTCPLPRAQARCPGGNGAGATRSESAG